MYTEEENFEEDLISEKEPVKVGDVAKVEASKG